MLKFFKRTFIIAISLIAILLISALFMNTKYSVKREIVINQPVEEVFAYIKQLKNQSNYSVWQRMDPKIKNTYIGKDASKGFVAAWESNNEKVGKGEQEITRIVENKRIDFALRFYVPFEANDKAFMSTTAVNPKQTKVIWGFDGTMKYPTNLFLLIMDMEEMLGKDLENGLKNLKNILEKEF